MPKPLRVAVLGFSDFERITIASSFRLAAQRAPSYEMVKLLDEPEFLLADADHPPSVQLVQATERVGRTVFIGAQPPEDCQSWIPRPIVSLQVLRALDALAMPGAAPARLEPAPAPAQSIAPPPRPRPAAPTVIDVLLDDPPPPPRRAAPAAPAPPSRPRALVVDDSAIALHFLQTRLERWGLDVTQARNSREALALLEEEDFDFAFLDVELGSDSELDGLALCRRIKSDSSAALQTTVVMVSAHQGESDRVRGTLAGCDAYLGKPLDEVELHRLMLRHGLRAVAEPPPAVAD